MLSIKYIRIHEYFSITASNLINYVVLGIINPELIKELFSIN